MTAALPPSLVTLLGGDSIEEKIGEVLLVIACDLDRTPRVASLSVGEILAVSPDRLLLTMYESSRTSQALASGSRGVLHAVVDGAIAKVEFSAVPLDKASGRIIFNCTVESVERDEVPYARVTGGVSFQLTTQKEQVVERWRNQLKTMRKVAG